MCDKPFGRKEHWATLYCRECGISRQNDPVKRKAHAAVSRAIGRGELPRAKDCTCVDCGKPAFDYDHRDYLKPLEVDPVCRSCNRLRGPGANAIFKDESPTGRVRNVLPLVSDSLVSHGAEFSLAEPLNATQQI